ncbi:hypothetical protein GDO81_022268 [Engystomops pustulosus]|uniref:Uncharacterized protein n=1 Tax=Engystomops pustulosus TaxID=76066 RepID=A0AAV6YU36_ENGPU|nr:hypothetical protein GDO81_022268 [Engystomops pustulosus]
MDQEIETSADPRSIVLLGEAYLCYSDMLYFCVRNFLSVSGQDHGFLVTHFYRWFQLLIIFDVMSSRNCISTITCSCVKIIFYHLFLEQESFNVFTNWTRYINSSVICTKCSLPHKCTVCAI